jgi:TrmH family RNA methyltransferase
MSLSNRQIKLINSLHSKKGRKDNLKFLVEGEKVINELFNSNWKIDFILLNEKYIDLKFKDVEVYYLKEEEINKLSSLQTNTFGIAVVEMKSTNCDYNALKGTYLFLDGIRDPGNLGTIIRLCDWYGIQKIFVSGDTTEFYNPKTIISTMGSFTRIEVITIELEELIKKIPQFTIIGTFLNGQSIYQYEFPKDQIIVLGNESQGIRPEIESYISQKITIPKIGEAESLNVAISTAIVLDNIIRK